MWQLHTSVVFLGHPVRFPPGLRLCDLFSWFSSVFYQRMQKTYLEIKSQRLFFKFLSISPYNALKSLTETLSSSS